MTIPIRRKADRVGTSVILEADAERRGWRYGRHVRRELGGLPLLDVGLAVALLTVKVVALATGIQPGSVPVSYLAAPFITLPLAWRRSHPLAAACVVMTASAAEVVVGGYHDSVVALAVLIVVPYSLAAYATAIWRMIAGMAATVADGVTAQAAQPTPQNLATTLAGDAALLVVPFLVGLALRQQRLRAETLERLARQLEREREERARTAVAEERTRIARELHDEVAHAMSVIAVQADAAEGALSHDPSLVVRPLLAIRDTAREALVDMRRVLGALRGDEQAELGPEPGLARLGALVQQMRDTGLDVDLRIEGEPVPLPPPVDLAAYRVLQEGLTNVRKHAAARRVEVVLRYGADAVGVEVNDDGTGDGRVGGSGRGLAGLRERVALLGGEFVAGPRARGFALRVTLPLA